MSELKGLLVSLAQALRPAASAPMPPPGLVGLGPQASAGVLRPAASAPADVIPSSAEASGAATAVSSVESGGPASPVQAPPPAQAEGGRGKVVLSEMQK